ncbi:DsbA family protein [Qipengyuania sp. MTN3-11]|uniref:DsbA family protein n=1 Tax=Qipengyuania sp. MTN3-11 TaxID=3056557 RepID=UPI0036F25104
MRQHIFTAILALVFGFVGAGLWSLSGLGQTRTRDYLLANPGILNEMVEALKDEQSGERLAAVGDELYDPFPGAVRGNPQGSRTLVSFTDHACGYCRQSEPDVRRLIAEDPELRVVVREWPIFEGSEAAARMALAAAEQGRYDAFYQALFELGQPTTATIARAAEAAGLDLERARRVADSGEVAAELARNEQLARSLEFVGTPAWVAGDRILQGAVGYDALAEAVKQVDGA